MCGSDKMNICDTGTHKAIPTVILPKVFKTEDVILVRSAIGHVLFLTKQGRVYGSCTSNTNSELGTKYKRDGGIQLIEELADRRIISLACMGEQSLFLDEDGSVYSCGSSTIIFYFNK
jgi:alpha-tubulin suppressor-like RCC1 family protein